MTMTKAGESILRGIREMQDYAAGNTDGFRVHIPESVDVRAIRRKTGLTQAQFAALYGFPVGSLRGWEQGRRQPDTASRAFLLVIDRKPEAVREALSA